jgi:hypothetical protein
MSNYTLFSQIRDHNREEAKKTLLAKHPLLEQLLKQMDVYMGQLVLFLNNKPTYDDKDKFHLPLAVTFIRLHYSIVDFLLCCDIIEASVLLRKQVEILARYHEVEQGIKPRGKGSANVHLISDKNIQKCIYGNLCDIAHYTKDESYYYLGYDNIVEDPSAPTVISTLAEYDEKVMDTISDFCEVFDYFCMLMQKYQKHLDANYTTDAENAWHKHEFVPTGKEIGLRYFIDNF